MCRVYFEWNRKETVMGRASILSKAPSLKDVLTTGDVAKICNVAPRTVCKWFDAGQLSGYRVPGSKDRRVPRVNLIAFMRQHGLPLNGVLPPQKQILVIDNDPMNEHIFEAVSKESEYSISSFVTAFKGALAIPTLKPQIVLVGMKETGIKEETICQEVKNGSEGSLVKVVALVEVSSSTVERYYQKLGFDGVLTKPFTTTTLGNKLNEMIALFV